MHCKWNFDHGLLGGSSLWRRKFVGNGRSDGGIKVTIGFARREKEGENNNCAELDQPDTMFAVLRSSFEVNVIAVRLQPQCLADGETA
jgi:hypothetical protein